MGPFSLLLFLTIAVVGAFLVQAVALGIAPRGHRRSEPSPRERAPGDSIIPT